MPQLATVANVKTWLRIGNANDDALLTLLLDAAEAAIFRLCGRAVGAQAQWGFASASKTEYLDGCGVDKLALAYTPVTAVASAGFVVGADSSGVETIEAIDLTALTVDGYPIGGTMNAESGVLGYRNAGSNTAASFDLGLQWPEFPGHGTGGATFPEGHKAIKVVYTGGYSVIPDDLEQAAIELTGHLFKRRRQYPVRPGEQADARAEAPPSVNIPSAVRELLGPYRRLPL